MAEKRPRTSATPTIETPRAPGVSMDAIRELAGQIAERFRPDRIILFGSYAYGTPHEDSDVDLLVVMPAANMINQAVKISLAVHPPFAMDLIVRTPAYLRRRLEGEDWFLREVVGKGKVLYEGGDEGVGSEGRGGPVVRRNPGRSRAKGS